MAGYAESNASFRHRAKQIQLTDDHITALHDNDIRCFNHMAFAVNGQPGQLDQERFQGLVDIVCPRGASLGVQASLKQLAYEALTVAVAAIKQRVETPSDDAAKKLPPQEKDQRLRTLKQKITGFDVSGDYEPGHCAIDAFAGMLEESVLKFWPLSKCVSREQELQSVKADKQVIMLENQQLQVKARSTELTADLGNELRVHMAFIRRGLALDMANLATYEVHEKVMREFMSHLTRQPPPGFRGPTIESVLRADKELWTRVADRVRSDLRPDRTGSLPVDAALTELCTSAAVVFHLLPLPGSGSSNAPTKRKTPDEAPTKIQAPEAHPGTKNKNRRGKRNRQGRTNLPSGLHGYSGWNKQKQRICFNFNMAHGCSNAVTKDGNVDKCNRGTHQCIKCHGKHSLTQCTN